MGQGPKNDSSSRKKRFDFDLITQILKRYEIDANLALWEVQGAKVIYHSFLEQIAAKAGIVWDLPVIVEANTYERIATMIVSGTLTVDGVTRREWSVGEAAPINIDHFSKKENKMVEQAYPWSFAEKRGKDRVVLKLIGLHGQVYSEDEAVEFQMQRPDRAAREKKRADKIKPYPEPSAASAVDEPPWLNELLPGKKLAGKTWRYLVEGDESNQFAKPSRGGKRTQWLRWVSSQVDDRQYPVARALECLTFLEKGWWGFGDTPRNHPEADVDPRPLQDEPGYYDDLASLDRQ